MFVSRDVVFVENTFPMSTEKLSIFGDANTRSPSDFDLLDNNELLGVAEGGSVTLDRVVENTEIEAELVETEQVAATKTAQAAATDDAEVTMSDGVSPEVEPTENLGRGLRQKTASVKVKDYVLNTIGDSGFIKGENDDMEFEI